jgi:hypothetical protein
MLYGINTAVGYFDNFIESDESSLKRSEFDQKFDGALEVFLQFEKLLTTSRQSGQLVRIRAVLIRLENRKRYT